MEATHWTRLACHRFRANEVRLLLGVIAYNLGNLWPWTRGGVKRRDPHGSLLSMIQVSSRLCHFLSPGQS